MRDGLVQTRLRVFLTIAHCKQSSKTLLLLSFQHSAYTYLRDAIFYLGRSRVLLIVGPVVIFLKA